MIEKFFPVSSGKSKKEFSIKQMKHLIGKDKSRHFI